MRVAVVGAGISGLGAAYALQRAGVEVLVLERSAQVGGRMQTRSEQGFVWDAGAQFLLDDFKHMKQVMQELGVIPTTGPAGSVSATVLPGGKRHYMRTGSLGDVWRHPALSVRSKWRLGRLMIEGWKYRRLLDFYRPEKAAPIDSESLRGWGDREIGQDAVDWFLSLATSALFFWKPEETPWWYVAAFARAARRWGLFTPQGGMGAVPSALARKVEVRTNVSVHRIDLRERGVVLKTSDPSGVAEVAADRVVLAVPAPEALVLLDAPDQVLGPERAEYLRSTEYARSITVAVAFRSQPERRAYGVHYPLALNTPLAAVEWTHVKDRERTPDGMGLAVLMARSDYAASCEGVGDDEVVSALIGALEEVYPGCGRDVLFSRVKRWKHAIPLFPPGRMRKLQQALQAPRPHPSPVFLCGDYWVGPSTESALWSGRRAADEVLKSMGIAANKRKEVSLEANRGPTG